MSDDRFSPEMIKAIADEFKKAVDPIRTEVAELRSAFSSHCMEDTKKEKDRIELQISSQKLVEASHSLIREMKDAPEQMHGWAKTFFEEKTASEIKRMEEKIDGVKDTVKIHLESHESNARAQRRGIMVSAGTAILMTAIAVLSYFGIKLPGSK